MTQKQYDNYLKIANQVTGNDSRAVDLMHDVLIQLMKGNVFNTLPQRERVYFFIRAIKNQYYSKNSYFYRDYIKYDFKTIQTDVDIPDYQNDPKPSLEWVNECLNKLDWYEEKLFKLYLDLKSIDKVSKQTKIPIYSIRKTIKWTKEYLNQEWVKYVNSSDDI